MKITAMIFLIILLSVVPLFALEFQANVVRQGGNLYWAETENMFIQTEYCDESTDAAAIVLHPAG